MVVIGNTIYQKIIDKNESKHEETLAEVEGRIRSAAAEEKDKALKEAKEIAENELETAMAAAKKAQVQIIVSVYNLKGSNSSITVLQILVRVVSESANF